MPGRGTAQSELRAVVQGMYVLAERLQESINKLRGMSEDKDMSPALLRTLIGNHVGFQAILRDTCIAQRHSLERLLIEDE